MLQYVSVNKIRFFFWNVFREKNVRGEVAEAVINALINASLFGIDSHGVNLFEHYIESVVGGRVQKDSEIEITTKGNSFQCNSNHNFSHFAANKLLSVLDNFTSQQAIALGTIANSDHIGAVGIHAYNSNVKNKLIFGFTNADALANTPDGLSVVFGTNPISLVLKGDDDLLYIDLATTKYSMNKIKNYRKAGISLPQNIARDENMILTNDPNRANTLEPIGEHKGFALAFIVEMLTSGLSGQTHSIDLLPMYGTEMSRFRGVSHTFIMINPERISNGLSRQLWHCVMKTRKGLSQEQERVSPGRKELHTMKERNKVGIPILPEILDGWHRLGFKL